MLSKNDSRRDTSPYEANSWADKRVAGAASQQPGRLPGGGLRRFGHVRAVFQPPNESCKINVATIPVKATR